MEQLPGRLCVIWGSVRGRYGMSLELRLVGDERAGAD